VNLSIEENNPDREKALIILDSIKPQMPSFSKRQKMAYNLVYSKAMNVLNVQFTSDSLMLDVNDYYKSNGNKNERMWAEYLLGCVYRDLNDAPKALSHFNKALEYQANDKQSYRMLARIHGQKAEIFSRMGMDEASLLEDGLSAQNSFKAGDTVRAIYTINAQSFTYSTMGKTDSALKVKKEVIKMLKDKGLNEDAETMDGESFAFYIHLGDFATAKKKIDIYERTSQYFTNGEIEKGHEVYYYLKGLYYLGVNVPDSAEILFRKCLKYKDNSNNIVGGYRGLSLLYNKLGVSDSAAKYALLSYEANDSSYQRDLAYNLNQLQSLYDYSYYRDQAAFKTEEANKIKMLVLFISCLLIVAISTGVLLYKRQRERTEARISELTTLYENDNARLEQEKAELNDMLRDTRKNGENLIKEKENYIKTLEEHISQYEKHISSNGESVDECLLQNSATVKRLRFLTTHTIEKADEGDWENLSKLMSKKVPELYILLQKQNVTYQEKIITYLIRLNFRQNEISTLTGQSAPLINSVRKRLLKKIFNIEGKASEYDNLIVRDFTVKRGNHSTEP